jgi:hypothetical protein
LMIAQENQKMIQWFEESVEKIRSYQIQVRPLALKDFELALKNVQPETKVEENNRYFEWKNALDF